MTLPESANATARFALELFALAALGYWGLRIADSLVLDVILGLGAPLAFAMAWGAVIAPKAPYRLPDPQRLMLEVTLFGLAAIALVAAGSPVFAFGLMVAVAVNIALMLLLDQRRRGGI